MYGFTNEAGEPIMDAAAYRYEQYIDSQYEPEPDSWDDSWDEDDDYADTATCTHGNGSYPENAGFSCDDCGETFEGPRWLYVTPDGPLKGCEWDVFVKRY